MMRPSLLDSVRALQQIEENNFDNLIYEKKSSFNPHHSSTPHYTDNVCTYRHKVDEKVS